MRGETLWQTSVQTTAEAEDAVAELFASLAAPTPSSYTDAETGATIVSVFFKTAPTNPSRTKSELRRGLAMIKACGLNVGAARITIRKLPREDWAESWKRHFPPLEIGGALLVKPSWSKRKPRAGQSLVVLDPGLSFGTGQHPTTEFCLRELVRAERGRSPSAAHGSKKCRRPFQPGPSFGCAATGDRSRSLLDIGTGSGILAIAAAKLGYAPVHAFDFDPKSVQIARINARRNRVESKLRITRADLTQLPRRSGLRYDIVCANLLADLLIAERARILARVKPGGILIVAGILKREFDGVVAAYRNAGMKVVASKSQNEWRSATLYEGKDARKA